MSLCKLDVYPARPLPFLRVEASVMRKWRLTATAAALAAAVLQYSTAAVTSAAAPVMAGLPQLCCSGAATARLIVGGQPFLILGGELANSSAGTATQADTILPRLRAEHFNTVLMPVPWDEIEPREGRFDFSIPDHWIAVARQQRLHLVLLWFGSWKNAFSSYAPAWVLADTQRFPRAVAADGSPLPILSAFGAETMRRDGQAFAALMRHVRAVDSAQRTVLMAQVENEVGYLGLGGRDRSPEATRLFAAPVPRRLLRALAKPGAWLPRELAEDFTRDGRCWQQAFGGAADEVFMSWYYARFIDSVAQAGKRAYPLPLYMNAQLPAPHERAGDYPSGGPYPLTQPIYRAAAPAIDFYAPDIYWPDFEHWITRYRRGGNPVFVPESRLELAQYNALYVFGEARGLGFSAFAVDETANPALAAVYRILGELGGRFIRAQEQGDTRALVLHLTSPRPYQTVALDGYLFRATLARSWITQKPLASDGAMLVMSSAPGEFYILGSGLDVSFLRDPDVDDRIAGIDGIAELAWKDRRWTVVKQMNGDQSDQGRQLLMDPRAMHLYRLSLYAYPRR